MIIPPTNIDEYNIWPDTHKLFLPQTSGNLFQMVYYQGSCVPLLEDEG